VGELKVGDKVSVNMFDQDNICTVKAISESSGEILVEEFKGSIPRNKYFKVEKVELLCPACDHSVDCHVNDYSNLHDMYCDCKLSKTDCLVALLIKERAKNKQLVADSKDLSVMALDIAMKEIGYKLDALKSDKTLLENKIARQRIELNNLNSKVNELYGELAARPVSTEICYYSYNPNWGVL